jgi:hypothetical protein
LVAVDFEGVLPGDLGGAEMDALGAGTARKGGGIAFESCDKSGAERR